jgi:hypothetical protein
MASPEQRGKQPQEPTHDNLFVDKVESSLKKRELRQRNRRGRPIFRNRRIARADLTPEELEHQELLDNIIRLKRVRTISGRINFVEEDIEDKQLSQMQQIEPEFMTPSRSSGGYKNPKEI